MRTLALIFSLSAGAAVAWLVWAGFPTALNPAPLPAAAFVAGLLSAYALRLLAEFYATPPRSAQLAAATSVEPPQPANRLLGPRRDGSAEKVGRPFWAWVGTGALGGLALGLASHVQPTPRGVAAILAALAAAGLLAAGLWRIFSQDERVGFEHEWGALGHSAGGWRVTPTAALLGCGLLLAGIAAFLVQ